MKKQSKQAAAEVFQEILNQAPVWVAAGRLRGRRLGLSMGAASVLVWRELGESERFSA